MNRTNTSRSESQDRIPRPSLNSDPLGRDLVVTIRLAPDGRVFFHDITTDLEPVVTALSSGTFAPANTALKEPA